jgi:transcription termination/antitermination protein NusA
MELEKDNLYKVYKEKLEKLLPVKFTKFGKKKSWLLDDEGNELLLPKSEQIPSDYFKKGEPVRAVVAKVDMRNSNPVIILVENST